MAYGIATQSSSGSINMISTAMNGVFYNSNGQYTYTSGLSTSGFNTQFAVETPISTYYAYLYGSQAGSVNAPGAAAAGGGAYYQPAAYSAAGNIGSSPSISPNTCHVYTFGVPQQATGYGFTASGSTTGSISVDANHKAYYIQPAADGSFIRSATASSLPSGTTESSSYGQQAPTNVYFDKAYTNPPLIFITSSSGPIAANYFNRDGNGKFVSASIVAASSFSGGSPYGTAPYTGNTYSFSYFLVSDEEPVYGGTSSYGMRVFNSAGTKVFDSAYFCPTFQAATISRPYMYLDGSGSSYNYGYNYSSFTKTANLGVCINNCNAITGHGVAISYVVGPVYFGPFAIFGRYLTVSSTSATVQGWGTCGQYRYFGQSTQGVGASWDYTKGATSTMDILFCNYYY